MKWTTLQIAKTIDHSLLHPTMTDKQILEGLHLAIEYNVAAVCVKPYSVPMASRILKGTGIGICSVVGFPHGNSSLKIKCAETELAISDGATEIDMVINIGKALSLEWGEIENEIAAISEICNTNNSVIKVIFENDFLGDEHIIRLCEICSVISVDYIKTSTGYGFVKLPDGNYSYRGATLPHVKLMKRHAAPHIKIKAAGGIRNLDDVIRFLDLGVARIGATATRDIIEESRIREKSNC